MRAAVPSNEHHSCFHVPFYLRSLGSKAAETEKRSICHLKKCNGFRLLLRDIHGVLGLEEDVLHILQFHLHSGCR